MLWLSRVVFQCLHYFVPFSSHWYIFCILPHLSSGASSKSSISRTFHFSYSADLLKTSLQNHSTCAQGWSDLDGNWWLLWTFCFGFKFSLSVQSVAFDWPGYVRLCAKAMLYYFGYNASVSWLLEKVEMLPSVERICRVGKGVVRLRSFWGEQQFIKESATLAFWLEAKLYFEF